jgi:hypothetical protein
VSSEISRPGPQPPSEMLDPSRQEAAMFQSQAANRRGLDLWRVIRRFGLPREKENRLLSAIKSLKESTQGKVETDQYNWPTLPPSARDAHRSSEAFRWRMLATAVAWLIVDAQFSLCSAMKVPAPAKGVSESTCSSNGVLIQLFQQLHHRHAFV